MFLYTVSSELVFKRAILLATSCCMTLSWDVFTSCCVVFVYSCVFEGGVSGMSRFDVELLRDFRTICAIVPVIKPITTVPKLTQQSINGIILT